MQLPFYIAENLNRRNENRDKNAKQAMFYFNQFLKLMEHYSLLQGSEKDAWKNLENGDFSVSREEKINGFKTQKELLNKLKVGQKCYFIRKYLEKCEDEAMKKEFYLLQFQKSILESLSSLRLLKQETEILEYKERLEKDPATRQQHEQMKNKKVQPLQTITIPVQLRIFLILEKRRGEPVLLEPAVQAGEFLAAAPDRADLHADRGGGAPARVPAGLRPAHADHGGEHADNHGQNAPGVVKRAEKTGHRNILTRRTRRTKPWATASGWNSAPGTTGRTSTRRAEATKCADYI